jgi:hypothetical protein
MDGDITEAQSDNMIVSFDGRVLEVFGFTDPLRYHVRELEVKTDGPDKKGRYQVTVGSRHRGSAQITVEEADWPEMQTVLERAQQDAEDEARS